jgi:linoleoyl-CoA desaturase
LPNICHIHYKKISGIVELTAKEHGIPYHTKSTLASAIWDHIKMLKELGKVSPLEPITVKN